jgi:uncharacterized membrane protein YfcA
VTPAAGIAAGLLAGLLSGAFGVGGGVVLLPLLALWLGLSQHEAQGVTLAVLLLPIGLPAVLAYHRRNPIRWSLVGTMVLGFVAGVGAGSFAAAAIPERPLRGLYVLFLLFAAWRTWAAGGRPVAGGAIPSAWHGLWVGAVGGVAAGLLGIGGGIVMVPLLVSVLRLGQHEAQGVSLAVMLPPVGLPGVLVYARTQGGLPWGLMAQVAAGFGVGALFGARLAVRVRGPQLARAFALFVLAMAAAMAWRALRG